MEADVTKQNMPAAQALARNEGITSTHHLPLSITVMTAQSNGDGPSPLAGTHNAGIAITDGSIMCNDVVQSPKLKINEEQQRAFDIIVGHLDATLAGQDPEPLRMIVHGEGGTSKSTPYDRNTAK